MRRFPFIVGYWREMLPSLADWAMAVEQAAWQHVRVVRR